jgi:hypothetical protein
MGYAAPMSRSLQTSQPIKLVLAGPDGPVELEGTVVGTANGVATVCFPDHEELPAAFVAGAAATLKIWDVLGLHLAETRILGTLFTGSKAPGVSLAMPPRFETRQLRQYFRVRARIAVAFTVKVVKNPSAKMLSVQSAMTDDVSAGGLRFWTPLPLAVGDLVEVSFMLRQGGTAYRFEARVMRTVPVQGPGADVSVEFQGVREGWRDRVISDLFFLQRP